MASGQRTQRLQVVVAKHRRDDDRRLTDRQELCIHHDASHPAVTVDERMNIGDEKTERIDSENAYGPHRDELVFKVGREQLPDGSEVEVGDVLKIGFPDGSTAAVQVRQMDDVSLTLDANHPLAGKDLTFELRLVAIG